MRRLTFLLLIVSTTVVGCAPAPMSLPPPKPPQVNVALPVSKQILDYEDFTGRTEAVAAVDVRARATGYLDDILFTDGAMVKAGDPLFVIDRRPYEAENAMAEAELSQATASLNRLDADYRRATNLLAQRAMSREVFDKIAADRLEAEASVGKAKANIARTQLNLEYARVTAPISGRASRRSVDKGNLVEANETLLTSIVALDPMYISFDVDERTVLRLRRITEEGSSDSVVQTGIPINFGLADEEGYPHKGKIDFLENKVDIGTGTLRMRGVFANPHEFFSPGLFVRVRLYIGKPHPALLLPERAIGTDQGQKFVFVVNDKDEVEYRPVKTGSLNDGMRVIENGVSPQDRVVVNGLQRVRAGAKVVPKLVTEPQQAKMFSRFFIDRPIFAAVLSIVITLAGALSIPQLPVAQFPRISPPNVSVSCNYPGASAQDVAEAVAAPIEQQVNGVEGMMYMSSQCTNDGSYSLSVTFHQNVDADMAQVLVQNRVSLALPNLPDVIKATGVTTRKRSPDILMGIAIISPNNEHDQLYLSNYAQRMIVDELLRVPGVSDITVRGQRDCSMRVWVDPAQLAARSMTAMDVVQAIRDQNAQIAAGMIGQPPTSAGQNLQLPLDLLGRLETVEQFQKIIVKSTPEGRVVRLKDVARVEIGARNEDINCKFNGMDTIFLPIFQLPDSNALHTHELVLAKMDELKKNFPSGVDYRIAFDTVPYTRESIHEVIITLRDAIILVAVVVLVFLQNWRSAVIPLVAVPVAIIGTFAVMAAIGFSLNNLTLFGLVLAIGIVVDDAIVVVEAVEHHIEHGLAPREATIKAMQQVSGPVIAVGLVLSAVFLPCAFISGITGEFFRQFALTIAVSTIISAFNSLTLSPALAALLLRPIEKHAAPPLPRLAIPVIGGILGCTFLSEWTAEWLGMIDAIPEHLMEWLPLASAIVAGMIAGLILSRPINFVLGWSFRKFNAGFGWITRAYAGSIRSLLRVSFIALLVYGGLLGITLFAYNGTPKGFIPAQDMGYLLANVQLPDSASMERTEKVMEQLANIVRNTPGVRHVTTIAGQSFALNASGSNFGTIFVNLKDYHDRQEPHLSGDAIAQKLRGEFAAKILDANVAVFGPPPVRGVGRAGGFTFVLEDRGDLGSEALQEQVDNLVAQGNQQKGMVGLFSVFRSNVPQLRVAVNIGSCLRRQVNPSDFAETLRIYQGSMYVNDFNLFGRTWQVIVQADAPYRKSQTQISQLKLRNGNGGMVPIGALATIKEVNGPLVLTRYNMYPAATINGSAGQGLSSRQAIDIMQRLANQELPQAMAYEWTDMSYLELQAGSTPMLLFALAVIMVFLVLAAQYESWSLPLAVILVVPLCLLSAIIGVNIARMDINIFTQIGFVVLVGLSSKNAILIVEYAKSEREAGVPRDKATIDACRLRLRPIIMTSLAFILGVVPLMTSYGAGAEMRRTLGVAVFSGMVGVTLFGIFLTPVFYYVINWIGDSRELKSPWMRRLVQISLGIFALGYLKRLGTVAVRSLQNPTTTPNEDVGVPPSSADGSDPPPPETGITRLPRT